MDCVQKGRVYHKLAYFIFVRQLTEHRNEAIDLIRDSTLQVWRTCDTLEESQMWAPSMIALILCEYENELHQTKSVLDYLEQNPKIIEKVSLRRQNN